MLVICYLASAAFFYAFVSKRAPIEEESVLTHTAQAEPCEVLELFAAPLDEPLTKAA